MLLFDTITSKKDLGEVCDLNGQILCFLSQIEILRQQLPHRQVVLLPYYKKNLLLFQKPNSVIWNLAHKILKANVSVEDASLALIKNFGWQDRPLKVLAPILPELSANQELSGKQTELNYLCPCLISLASIRSNLPENSRLFTNAELRQSQKFSHLASKLSSGQITSEQIQAQHNLSLDKLDNLGNLDNLDNSSLINSNLPDVNLANISLPNISIIDPLVFRVLTQPKIKKLFT